MCLQQILEIPEEYKTGEHVGYKVLVGQYYTPIMSKYIKLNEWVFDDNPNIINIFYATDMLEYKLGFHIFINRKDADDYVQTDDDVVVKVKFKDVVAYGLEGSAKVIVAKQMYVDKQHLPT